MFDCRVTTWVLTLHMWKTHIASCCLVWLIKIYFESSDASLCISNNANKSRSSLPWWFVILLDIISLKKKKRHRKVLPDFAEKIKDKLAAVNMIASYDKVPCCGVAISLSTIIYMSPWHFQVSCFSPGTGARAKKALPVAPLQACVS